MRSEKSQSSHPLSPNQLYIVYRVFIGQISLQQNPSPRLPARSAIDNVLRRWGKFRKINGFFGNRHPEADLVGSTSPQPGIRSAAPCNCRSATHPLMNTQARRSSYSDRIANFGQRWTTFLFLCLVFRTVMPDGAGCLRAHEEFTLGNHVMHHRPTANRIIAILCIQSD